MYRPMAQLLMFVALCFPTLFGQQAQTPASSPTAPSSPLSKPSSESSPSAADHTPSSSLPAGMTGPEFPVLLQQSVVAGKTAVGTKLQAKLWVATLVEGKVVPRNAVFSGEVVESVARTKDAVSRLSIRMDSVEWKTGSVALKLYLTAWYYPTLMEAGQDLQYGPTQSAKASWNGQGAYPDPNSRSYKPFPGSDTDNASAVPETPATSTSHHRVLMKDVESTQSADGAIALTSRRSNIKLDKLTTYVLATTDPLSAK